MLVPILGEDKDTDNDADFGRGRRLVHPSGLVDSKGVVCSVIGVWGGDAVVDSVVTHHHVRPWRRAGAPGVPDRRGLDGSRGLGVPVLHPRHGIGSALRAMAGAAQAPLPEPLFRDRAASPPSPWERA